MLSKAFSAAPKLPDIVFPKKIATEHNRSGNNLSQDCRVMVLLQLSQELGDL